MSVSLRPTSTSPLEVGKFHTKTPTILTEKLLGTKQQVEPHIMKLEATEQSILSRMNSIAASKAFTLEFLDAYTLLNRRISKLKYKNDAFDTRAQLQVARRRHRGATTNSPNPSCQRSKQPSTRKGSVYKVIGGEYNTPSLTLRSYRRFSFQTPKDNASDTDHHNMIIYDPAVL